MTDDWYTDEQATFGDRLTAAREAAGLAVADLARRLGVSSRTVNAWEADQSEPRANRMQMLAGLLNVSLRWLMTGVGPGIPAPGRRPEAPSDAAGLAAELRAVRGLILQAGQRLDELDRRLAGTVSVAE